jgi:hypothetical protein
MGYLAHPPFYHLRKTVFALFLKMIGLTSNKGSSETQKYIQQQGTGPGRSNGCRRKQWKY